MRLKLSGSYKKSVYIYCLIFLSDDDLTKLLNPFRFYLPSTVLLCIVNVVKCLNVDVRVNIDVSFKDLQKS